MAAAPPPPILPLAPVTITTYRQHYQTMVDPTVTTFNNIYTAHHPTTGKTAAELLFATVSSSNRTPKVFLFRIRHPDNSIRIVTVHCPSLFKANLLEPPLTWDNKIIAFMSDVHPTLHYIKTVHFPTIAFDVTAAAQTVPNNDKLSTRYAATVNDIVGPFNSGDPNTQDLHTRMAVSVPPPYVDLVLGRTFSPRQLWEVLGMVIINAGHQVSCKHLLAWIRMSYTRRPAPNTAPANHIGTIATTLVPVVDDEHIAWFRHDVLLRDLPALFDSNSFTSNLQLIQIAEAIRRDQADSRTADEAHRAADKQGKFHSATKYKTVALEWIKFCCVHDEADLPPIYHCIVHTDKTNHITLLCTAVHGQARNLGAAQTDGISPVVSKETTDMLLSCQFGVPSHEINNFTAGLQPFAISFFLSNELGKTVEPRAKDYMLTLAGHTAPTIGKLASFSSKEIRIPQDPFTAGILLATTSLLINVVQGVHHLCDRLSQLL